MVVPDPEVPDVREVVVVVVVPLLVFELRDVFVVVVPLEVVVVVREAAAASASRVISTARVTSASRAASNARAVELASREFVVVSRVPAADERSGVLGRVVSGRLGASGRAGATG